MAHYVYRCYDADSRLVYVGQTKNAVNRLKQHRLGSFWAGDVVSVRVTVHPSGEAARKVERHAIRNESPRFNVQGRWETRHGWSKGDYLDFTRAVFAGSGTPPTRARLELIFRLYEERFNEQHPAADAIRAELDRKGAKVTATLAQNKAEAEAQSLRIALADLQAMYAHLAFCEPCAQAGDYADDCPDLLICEDEGVFAPSGAVA